MWQGVQVASLKWELTKLTASKEMELHFHSKLNSINDRMSLEVDFSSDHPDKNSGWLTSWFQPRDPLNREPSCSLLHFWLTELCGQWMF